MMLGAVSSVLVRRCAKVRGDKVREVWCGAVRYGRCGMVIGGSALFR